MPVEQIYPTPIYYCFLDNQRQIDKELSDCIVNKTEFKMNKSWGATHFLSDPSFSENFIEDQKVDTLKSEILKHLNFYCTEIGISKLIKPKIYSSWVSLFKENNYGHIHDHGHSDISGVYYYRTSGEDGKIFFETPNPHLSTSFCYEQLSTPWEHTPIEGKLLLFPGWLKHGIRTNPTKKERISISFNISFER